MNVVLELQKLVPDIEGKGQALDATFTITATCTVKSSVSAFICRC